MRTDEKESKSWRFLIAVDDSDSSHKAVSYVANLLSHSNGAAHVILFHLLPPLPPQLVEHGGAEDPDEERRRGQSLAKKRERWIEQAQSDAEPFMESSKAVLRRARIRDEDIDKRYVTTMHAGVAQEALEAASELGCGTIVVGRKSFPWYRELTQQHVADALVQHAENIAVCVVE